MVNRVDFIYVALHNFIIKLIELIQFRIELIQNYHSKDFITFNNMYIWLNSKLVEKVWFSEKLLELLDERSGCWLIFETQLNFVHIIQN